MADKPKYEHAFNTLFALEATREEKHDAIKTMYHLLRAAKHNDENATTILNFMNVTSDFLAHLLKENKAKEATRFAADVGNNRINTAEDVFGRARELGYTEWAKQETGRLSEYTSFIKSLAITFAAQMAAQQAQRFQMSSTTQQLEAIIDFVDKMVKKKEEEKSVGGEEKKEAPAKRKKKAEEAEKLLASIEGGETASVSRFATQKLYDEVGLAQLAKDGLNVREIIKDAKFQDIYEDNRNAELRSALKDLVPAKASQVGDIMKAGKGGEKVDLGRYDIAIQTALVTAYRKSLEQYQAKGG
ncbi:MAG: hypothetical protein PHV13_03160 [Candidatus ainarchaeum sp.]|nr:hypothetical protein [Candidatus ainarchaeum sp.]